MIVVKIKGGLGNQLFQYFAGYALGKKYHQPIKYDLSYFKHGSARPGINKQKYQLDKILNVNIDIVAPSDLTLLASALNNNYVNKLFRVLQLYDFSVGNWQYILQNRSKDAVKIPESFDNLSLDGYWQNLSWIEPYQKQIQDMIEIQNVSDGARSLVEQAGNSNSVAVHVRRTDLLSSNANIQKGNYYAEAIGYIKKRIKNPVFFVFSDDITWCKENLLQDGTEKVVYSDNKTAMDDFYCMMHCKHNIIAFSTFSWWAAWLNKNEQQIVVAPDFGREDIRPRNWWGL